MSNEIVSIKINVKGNIYELSLREAKDLYWALAELFRGKEEEIGDIYKKITPMFPKNGK